MAGAIPLIIAAAALAAAGGDVPPNLVRHAPGGPAAVSVDSAFPGYSAAVLADGRWIEEGKEPAVDSGSPDRLGNAGNTWVSAETDAGHWARIDWPRPVAVDEVEVWWSLPEWLPRAFRVEVLLDGRWQPPPGSPPAWLAATGRRSVVPFPAVEARSLRVVQPPGGGGSRTLLAAQEVLAFRRGGGRPRSGARELAAGEARRLAARALARNIARPDCPGAASAVAWMADGSRRPAPGLADGDVEAAALADGEPRALGIEWTVEHVIDGLALRFRGDPPAAEPVPEVHDGERWVPIGAGLRAERGPGRIAWSFEPAATRAARVRLAPGTPAVTELEAYRWLPAAKDVWPVRLTGKGGLRDEVLAGGGDPSFESLALAALPMTPARALLGLDGSPREFGVTWDGTVIGRETVRFAFGDDRDSLADFRDSVRRTLIDGWRPGTVVEGRAGAIEVRETAFVAPAGDGAGAALFIRVELTAAEGGAAATSVRAEIARGAAPVRAADGALLAGDAVALIAAAPSRPDDGGRSLRVDLALDPGRTARIDFVVPEDRVAPGPAAEPYRSASFDDALRRFRTYWDRILAGAPRLEVPEARIERMAKAVLAQVFICGDGDVMPYGAWPSCYDGALFGVEEGYAMVALAEWGFGADARRYLDGTYLTPAFLRKVDAYRDEADRHQQYRNGLCPHYAATVFRLARDEAWIRRHLPLLRECAEWTIAQTRRTAAPAGGPAPLHAGLLPEWAYGGDIGDVRCHALYANYACWRGLADTAWLAGEMGDAAAAARYREEARAYRAAIDRAVDGTYRRGANPPFLPLRLYADRPDEQMDYYQLFAGCLLDLAPFEKGAEHYRWIARFLDEDNRTFCLLPRFRRDAGAGGLDALYGKGHALAKLREDAVGEYLLAFYAFLAFNLDRETFASRETNVIYASDLHVRSAYPVPDASDPVPCSSAVALQLLRNLLVTEDRADPAGDFSDLLLLPAAPRAWLRDGRTIRFAGAPTAWGPVSFEVRSAAAAGRIEAEVTPPERGRPRAMKLRLRHPDRRPIRSVTVDGAPWADFDPAGEWILVPPAGGPHRVVAAY